MSSLKYTKEQIFDFLKEIPDPEIPVITIVELGMVRGVIVNDDEVEVLITPTYTGCPATKAIENDIVAQLNKKGVDQVKVKHQISPPWTTDWITEEAREKLRKYGIAPPNKTQDKSAITGGQPQACPKCNSTNTEMVSQFGSTPCKALYKCKDCLEPFDYFKCL